MLHIVLLIFATVYEKGMSFSLFDRWQNNSKQLAQGRPARER